MTVKACLVQFEKNMLKIKLQLQFYVPCWDSKVDYLCSFLVYWEVKSSLTIPISKNLYKRVLWLFYQYIEPYYDIGSFAYNRVPRVMSVKHTEQMRIHYEYIITAVQINRDEINKKQLNSDFSRVTYERMLRKNKYNKNTKKLFKY